MEKTLLIKRKCYPGKFNFINLKFNTGFDFVVSYTSKHTYRNCNCIFQRWSRGHKARGQGQRHTKNPTLRPTTALPRADPLEAKDRNARGQGQGPRTQAQVLSKKKKVFKNFFQAFSKTKKRVFKNFFHAIYKILTI